MSSLSYLLLLNAAVVFCLGTYVYLKHRSRLTLVFLIFNYGVAIWNITSFLLEEVPLNGYVNFVSQVQIVSSIIFFNALYYFSHCYPSSDKSVSFRINTAAVSLLLVGIFFTDYVTVASYKGGAVVFQDGFGYTLHTIYMLTLGILSLKQLIKSYYHSNGYRVHIAMLLGGIVLFVVLGTLFGLVFPIFGIYKYGMYSYLSSIFLSTFFAYVIIKHESLDLLMVSKTSAFLITNLCIIFTVVVAHHYTRHHDLLALTTFIALLIFWVTYAPGVQNTLITTAKRKFIKGYYDESELFEWLSGELERETDKPSVFRKIAKCIDDALELESIGFLIVKKSDEEGACQCELYKNLSFSPTQILEEDHFVINYLIDNISKPVLSKELPDDVRSFIGLTERGSIIPFESLGTYEGFIFVGERSVGVEFAGSDFLMFNRIMNYVNTILNRLTPFYVLENKFLDYKEKLHHAEIQLVRAGKIESIAHTTRQCHHEIRTPLSVIQLGMETVETVEDLKKFIPIALKEIEKAIVIIDETMKLTDVAKPSQERELVDVNQVLRRCFKLMPASGYNLDDELLELPETFACLSDLEVVFSNLINNARDAMLNGGVLTVKSYCENNNIIVTVADTGVGISDELKQKVWEPYKSGQTKAGRGWGLTIVHRIVTEHQGTVYFESEAGVGTMFTVRFPVLGVTKVSECATHLA